jgi:hypothetical protein
MSTPDTGRDSGSEGKQFHNTAAPTDANIEKPAPPDDDSETPGSLTTVVTALDWTGPDDPENPYNWSKARKFYHAFAPSLFAFAV